MHLSTHQLPFNRHQRVQEVILFVEWIPRTTAAYIGSWIAVFFMAVITQGLKVCAGKRLVCMPQVYHTHKDPTFPTQAGRLIAERRWYNIARAKGNPVKPVTMHPMTWMTLAQLRRNVGRSAMTGAF